MGVFTHFRDVTDHGCRRFFIGSLRALFWSEKVNCSRLRAVQNITDSWRV